MCRTKKQLVTGVALILFIGLMGALWWSLRGGLQLTSTLRPRDVPAAGRKTHEQRDRCFIEYGGSIELHYVKSTIQAFSFDLCDVINCKGGVARWRWYDVYLCRLPKGWPEYGDRKWSGRWDDVWSHSRPDYWGLDKVSNMRDTAAFFSLKRGQAGIGIIANPLLLTINGLMQNPWPVTLPGRCYNHSEDSFYMMVGVDQAGKDRMGLIKIG